MADQNQADAKRKAGTGVIWASLLGAMIVVISLPTVIVMLVALLPTLVSFITDRSPDKYSTFCIGGMNFSGTFPFLMDLWMGDHSFAAARDMITDVFNLGIMYSAAAVGWLLFAFIPPVVGAFLTVLSQRRVATLRSEQRELIEEWGESVTRTQEEEDARMARGAPSGPTPS